MVTVFQDLMKKNRPIIINREQVTYPKFICNKKLRHLIYALQTATFKKAKNGRLKRRIMMKLQKDMRVY